MPAKFSIWAVAAIPAIPIALSCSNDGDKQIKIPDANMADAPVVCQAAASYPGTPPPSIAFDVPATGSDQHVVVYQSILDNMNPFDALFIDLFAGYGAFTQTANMEIVPGTYPITGVEANWLSCGVCVLIGTDVNSQGAVSDWYLATSGSLTITNADINVLDGSDGSAYFRGSVSNLMFEHVGKAANGGPGSAVIQDGCKSMIASGTLAGKFDVGSATGGGNTRLIDGEFPVHLNVIRNRRN